MKSVLDVNVSCVPNYYTKDRIKPVNLLVWLKSIKYLAAINRIRSTVDTNERKRMKAELPAITPSGTFSAINEKGLIEHSGFIQFDIDRKDNEHIRNYSDLLTQLSKIRNIAYCGLSAGGQGWWGLVPIAYPDMHLHHWQYLANAFAHYGIKLDEAPKNICSLRGYSCDTHPYFNHEAPMLVNYERHKAPVITVPNIGSDNCRVLKRLIEKLVEKKVDITDGYTNWFAIGCSIASNFGESGRVLYHDISKYHKTYDSDTTNKQYTRCLLAAKDTGIGIIVKRCKEKGVVM